MNNRTMLALFTIIPLLLGNAAVHATEGTVKHTQHVQTSTSLNFFDPSTWMKPGSAKMPLNLAHPKTWMMFADPNAHTTIHTAFMNPENYTQFMQPQFWMQFMNPKNWLAWFNPASYEVLFKPETYLGWMRPEPYLHFMDPGIFMQMMNPGAYLGLMNPATYMQWMNPAAYTFTPADTADTADTADSSSFNWFAPETRSQSLSQGETQKSPGG